MKHPLTKIVFASVGMSAVIFSQMPAALSQSMTPPDGPEMMDKMGDLHPPMGMMNMKGMRPPQPSGAEGAERGPQRGPGGAHDPLAVAAKLAAAEIYLGITPEQLGAWRAYAVAVTDLFAMDPPHRPGPPMEGKGSDPQKVKKAEPGAMPAPGGDRPEKKGPPPPAANSLPGEMMADHILAQAEKAKALKAAVEALKPQLTAEQSRKLSEIGKALMPPPPRPGNGFPDAPPPASGPRD